MLLGAVADDLTGATDLSLTLSREGMKTVQVVGVPGGPGEFGDAEAVVVALKSRTIKAVDAVSQSIASAERLLDAGARQLVFKYCSTFDSTDEGNIGPVTEALLQLLGDTATIACPAFPTNGRSVYQGHLFVGDRLLSESPMKDHPLTPMRDSDLVRVLQRQTKIGVSLIPLKIVSARASAIASALKERRGIVVVDAVSDADLRAIGEAAATLKLVTGGSGIALGLPENFRRAGLLPPRPAGTGFSAPAGGAVILSGSCSQQTRRQVEVAITGGLRSIKVDPVAIADGSMTADAAVAFVAADPGEKPPLVYSSADPAAVKAAQETLGKAHAGTIVEEFLAEVATRLADKGFSRFIVAGGETSGAVVAALGVRAFEIGPEIDPGVPWVLSRGAERPVAMALKSGNFGSDDFFLKAWEHLQ
ncbi:MAG: 3-oxo-tetronate kinase [Bauldia sp.]